ncbi:class I SAM-dependent methyltransferase [Synechococcus sp. HJ21-Hayes]|jgi:2-polyprenyl-3-methyl-5-hydroxy-6-metoxy-1,4-benzoquinol methylase|uniref:class I SAM-dependent methyltransferase n=1 Tax=unclassified Synechococcus TaxID=2626047 RepID=UPI0020CECB7F|nr:MULTISPECIES: class I SAM-dependent methyltransferase [unclassified Synechococcus]MCP9831640.1 class I SAM-dependent methyltransferase [Synechococcus sp. JJ3a-Johnson]MCP9852566.1 class I SAM-dependent methyltransferase [Synechococcus sp. HJ21-Hayes]
MDRVCEPELMDEAEQAQAYAQADFSVGDQALVERLDQIFPAGLGARLLDLGCGPGNISFLLAERHGQATVLGVDGAEAMLALARQRLREQPLLEGRLSFQQALLPCPELAGGFSAVVSNSLLHHLHNPQVLWQALRQLGAPGTCIYMKDLRRPGSSATADELRQRYLAEAPPVLQRDYIASLHAAFRPEEVELQLAAAGLHSLRVEPLEDRYLEVWGQLT